MTLIECVLCLHSLCGRCPCESKGFARDDAEIAYATFDCNLEACATYLLQEREKMAAATDYGDFF
jgi:hypothetical protein